MDWWLLGGVLLLALAACGVLLFVAVKAISKREPYRSFLKLSTKSKLSFFRRLVKDKRVPRCVKAAPFILALYLTIPFDLVPDFIPVLGYMDDVAAVLLTLAIVMRFTPRAVVQELLEEAAKG
ncbi:MAG: DUF1232 domain-containing protein [Chloroflexi bacterium]|nr:DUF1232 domain-containing protein [Chloroflexota bacterium]